MFCFWCNRLLDETHGYSENQEPICASYSNPPSQIYNACKSRKNRLEAKKRKQAIEDAQNQDKTSSEASSHAVDRLTEALQIIITQNDELIALQRQQLNAPKPQIVTNTKVISTTTFEAPSNLDDDAIWGDVEIKKTTDVSSADRFRKQMLAMANKEGVWADKPKDMKQ